MRVIVEIIRHSYGRTLQVVTNDIETNAFRRGSGDIGRLSSAACSILNVGMRLRTRWTYPVAEILVRILIEVDDVRDTAVDREVARARSSNVSNARQGPAEQVLWAQIAIPAMDVRTETDDLVHFVFRETLSIKSVAADRPRELIGGRRIKRDDSIIWAAGANVTVCEHRWRCVEVEGSAVCA